jgi:hypothetical protein
MVNDPKKADMRFNLRAKGPIGIIENNFPKREKMG